MLLTETDPNSIFIGSLYIYLYLKENIFLILNNKEKFTQIKNLLINQILQVCENFPLLSLKRISYCISLIIAIDSTSNNSNFIQEIIEYGKLSFTKCYISIIILNTLYYEFEKLDFSEWEKYNEIKRKILNNIKEKVPSVTHYLNFLLENFNLNENNINNNNNNNSDKNYINNQQLTDFEKNLLSSGSKFTLDDIKSEILDLMNSLIKFDFNILFNPEIFHTLLNSFNFKNAEKISFIIGDCIKYLNSAMIHDKEMIFNIAEIINKIDTQHFQIIEGVLNYIDNFINVYLDLNAINNYKNFNSLILDGILNKDNQTRIEDNTLKMNYENIELFSAIAYIFSAIVKNYPFLIFMENALAQNIYQKFFFFLCCRNLRISSKMLPSLEEICIFLKESNFNEEPYNISENKSAEKFALEISVFFKSILGTIMNNCKFKKISIPILKKGIIIPNFTSIEFEDEEDDDSDDIKVLSLSEYRLQASEVYFSIFSIFKENLGKEGIIDFFNYLNGIIEDNCSINTSNNLNGNQTNNNEVSVSERNDKNYIIEVLIHFLNNISVYVQEDKKDYIEIYLLELTLRIFNTHIDSNEYILCSLMIFLDKNAYIISKNNNLFNKAIKLFLQSLKNKHFQIVSTETILCMIENYLEYNSDIYDEIFKIYIEMFDYYEDVSLSNLVLSLTNLILRLENNKGTYDDNSLNSVKLFEDAKNNLIEFKKFSYNEIVFLFDKILFPVNESFDKINNFIAEEQNILNVVNFSNNNEISVLLKNCIRKNMKIYSVFFSRKFISGYIFKKVYELFYSKAYKIIEFSFKYYLNDNKLIQSILVNYMNIFSFNAYLVENIDSEIFYNSLNFIASIFSFGFSNLIDLKDKEKNSENINFAIKIIKNIFEIIFSTAKVQREIYYPYFNSIFAKIIILLDKFKVDDVIFDEGNNYFISFLEVFSIFLKNENNFSFLNMELIKGFSNDLIKIVFYDTEKNRFIYMNIIECLISIYDNNNIPLDEAFYKEKSEFILQMIFRNLKNNESLITQQVLNIFFIKLFFKYYFIILKKLSFTFIRQVNYFKQ